MPTLKTPGAVSRAAVSVPGWLRQAGNAFKEPRMADEKVELKDVNFRQLFPWTALFDGFRVALDPKKLLLAAGGILVMSIGWQLLGWAFYTSRIEPSWASGDYGERTEANWDKFKTDRDKW